MQPGDEQEIGFSIVWARGADHLASVEAPGVRPGSEAAGVGTANAPEVGVVLAEFFHGKRRSRCKKTTHAHREQLVDSQFDDGTPAFVEVVGPVGPMSQTSTGVQMAVPEVKTW